MTIIRALLALRRAARERWLAAEELRCLPTPDPDWLHGDRPVLGFYTAEFYERTKAAACAADAAWFDAAVALANALWPRQR